LRADLLFVFTPEYEVAAKKIFTDADAKNQSNDISDVGKLMLRKIVSLINQER